MSTQTKIDESLVKYLQNVGYRKDKIIDDLADETSQLGSVSQMQIAKEQGQFLEIITKLSKAKSIIPEEEHSLRESLMVLVSFKFVFFSSPLLRLKPLSKA